MATLIELETKQKLHYSHIVTLLQDYTGKKGPVVVFSVVNSVVMFEAQFTEKILLNQLSVYQHSSCMQPNWTWCKICMGKTFTPLHKIPDYVELESYRDDWISLSEIHQTTVNVTRCTLMITVLYRNFGCTLLRRSCLNQSVLYCLSWSFSLSKLMFS